ncbi:poly-beta-1,6 N-acetyl-D-glucosamine export porin PgaA [Xenorhabdus sp. XENO-10]|uniref:Poly-beta-1,6 N-acetyl-D-glucosamine export porin PgaA n=1 Tax=Xenorhabdus yunnanensis TaxID=3025878 RepID=A0ABT5LCH7_9GAMM|nr:poly-beta-1,6 N-acetyl-D-glucosamine export porin PgaA [Xenorhabdus yunnanensis]MDC9588243.1 poly-beta-1,6 N-acetyl-D-glucosamine export porin PgaA [Xenorhabdus yunnanensis]
MSYLYFRPMGFHRYRYKLLSLFISLGCLITTESAQADYDALIQQARNGNTEPMLEYIRQEEKQHRLSASKIADWLQVASWAGHDDEVISLWQRYRSVALPARGISAVARAYRNQRQWTQAIQIWRTALALDQQNSDTKAGLIMTLADAKQDQEARRLAKDLLAHQPSAANYRLMAYVDQAAGRTWGAMQILSTAHERFPDNKEVAQDYLFSLKNNRVSSPAWHLGQQHSTQLTTERLTSEQLTSEQLRKLETDAAAELVRLSMIPNRSEKERFDIADKALARYENMLNQWHNLADAQQDSQRARIDRLGALLARHQMQEVINEYLILQKQAEQKKGLHVPEYAQKWAAAAYLNLRQPEKARDILRSLNRPNENIVPFGEISRPNIPPEDDIVLFYANVESEHLDAAQQLATNIKQRNPHMLNVFGSPIRIPNDGWLQGQQFLAESAQLHEDLPEAEKRFAHLARTAPGNQKLRIDLAAIWLDRGWSRRAESELKQIEGLDHRNLSLEIQQGYTALALQEWHQMDLLADDVITRAPENMLAKRFNRLRNVHHMSELRIKASQGINSDNPKSGKHSSDIDAVLYSPPLDDNWRLFAGGAYNRSQFSEERGLNRDLRGGVEWRSRDFWLEGEVSARNYQHGSKIGLRIAGWHDFNDQWRLGGSAEHLARNTPLRALSNNIHANGGQIYTLWRYSERSQWSARFAPSFFSDGNHRFEYGIDSLQRLYTAPYLKLDTKLELSTTHNTHQNTPYFNPKSDFTFLSELEADHIMYRHYQTVWSQQIAAGIGQYWQQEYSRGLITMVGYGQRIKWNDVIDAGVRITLDKRPYDGKRESNLQATFDLIYRF